MYGGCYSNQLNQLLNHEISYEIWQARDEIMQLHSLTHEPSKTNGTQNNAECMKQNDIDVSALY